MLPLLFVVKVKRPRSEVRGKASLDLGGGKAVKVRSGRVGPVGARSGEEWRSRRGMPRRRVIWFGGQGGARLGTACSGGLGLLCWGDARCGLSSFGGRGVVWIAAATLGGLVTVRLGAVGYGGARQPKRKRGAGALAPLWSRNGGLGRAGCGVSWNGETRLGGQGMAWQRSGRLGVAV